LPGEQQAQLSLKDKDKQGSAFPLTPRDRHSILAPRASPPIWPALTGSALTGGCAQSRSFWRIDDLPGRPEVDRFCRIECVVGTDTYALNGTLARNDSRLLT